MLIARLAALALATLAAPSLPEAAAQCGCWEFQGSSDGSQPTGRHEAAYVEFGGQFYLMGGRGWRPVERFDPVTEKWTNLGFPPLKLHHFQPVVWGDKIYALGAFQGDFPNEVPLPDIWIYDPALNTWTQGPAMPAARNRGSAAAVVYDDEIYLVGGNTLGHNGGAVPWLDRYDPATNSWTVLPNAPHARDHFTAAVVGNKLVAAGGRQTTQPNPFVGTIGPADVFDLTAGTWSSAPNPIPTQRAGTMTVARGEHVIVIGGESTVEAHDEVEALDVGTLEWVDLPKLIQGRHSGGAVILNDTVYVATGAGAPGGNPELNWQEKLILGPVLTQSAADLIANGDLDAGLTGWSGTGTLALHPDGGVAAPALEVTAGTAQIAGAAVAKNTYRLRALYQLVGGGSGELRLEYLDAGSAVIGQKQLALAPATAWTSVQLDGTTPHGATQVRVAVTAGGGASLRVDDVVLFDKPGELNVFGSPANALALKPSTLGPRIGTTWDPYIDHTEFAQTAILDLFGISASLFNIVWPDGTILIDPVGSIFSIQAPGARFSIPIAQDPGLVGITLWSQGASIDGVFLRMTNGLEVTIQL